MPLTARRAAGPQHTCPLSGAMPDAWLAVYIRQINFMNECEALDKRPSLSECQFSHRKASEDRATFPSASMGRVQCGDMGKC